MATTLDWDDQRRELVCRICGVDADAKLLGRVQAPGEDDIEMIRCQACGSVGLVDEARDTSPDDLSVDSYLEGGVGLGVIAATLTAVPPERVRRFLDVGCNYGFSLDLGRFAFGWDVLGVEPSHAALRGSRELDLPILQEYLTDDTPIDQPFDLVLASEVIEHVQDPMAFAGMLRRRLTPTGTLLLTTPAAEIVSPDEPPVEVLSALSPWYHTVLASRQGLHDLLVRAGFAVVDVVRERGSLLAMASNDPTTPAPRWERGTTPAFLEEYYGERARSADPGSALGGGMAVRWLRALVSRGAFVEAEAAVPRVVEALKARHGLDLDDPDGTRSAVAAGATVTSHLAGAAFALGMTCLLHRDDPVRAAQYFDLAVAAVDAWERRHSPLDLDSVDVRVQAAAHRAIALTRTNPAEAAALALTLGDHLDTRAAAGRDKVTALQCRVFVELVARGHLPEARALTEAVIDAAPRLVHAGPAARVAALDALFSLGIWHLNTGDAAGARRWFQHAVVAAEQQPADDAHASGLATAARRHVDIAIGRGATDEPTLRLHPSGTPHHGIDVYWCDAAGVYLEGWAHAGEQEVTGISVSVGGTTVAADLRPRPDLLTHWPALPGVERAGFAAYVPASPHQTVELLLHTDHGDHRVTPALPAHNLPRQPDDPDLTDELARLLRHAPPGPVLALGFRADSAAILDARIASLGDREVVTVDIHPGIGVDVVADVHRLADAVPNDHFAAVVSVSLLEHVAAPWLVAAQISRVLRTGGLSVHVAPWTWPTHAQPNDFWRMSDEGLKQLFGPATGFEHVEAGLMGSATVVPASSWRSASITMPSTGGHASAWIAARKVDDSASLIDWPLDVDGSAELARRYPTDGLAPAVRPLPSIVPEVLVAEQPDRTPPRRQGPTVTAIVPVYNGADYIEAALRSIAGQVLLPDEILVMDDGSTDDSAAVAEAFDSPVPLKVVRQPNGGQSAARNAAAALATGELLAFLDQDDAWHPRHLERLVRAYRKAPDIGWAYTDFDEIDHLGRTVTHSYIQTAGLPHPHRNLLELLAADLMVIPSASLIRASTFREVGGFDEDLVGYEDDDLFIRVFRAGWRSTFVREPLTRFRVHGTSSSAGARFRESRLRFIAKLAEQVPDDPRMRRHYVRDLVVPRMFQVTLGDYGQALRAGDLELARDIAGTARGVAAFGPTSMRRRRRLRYLAHPRLVAQALRVSRHLPSAARGRINPALRD